MKNGILEPKDLQIGDWVWYDPNVFKEDEYEPDKPLEMMQIKSGEDIDLAIEGCYSPIELTAEMLKKSGFEWGLTTEQEEMMSNVGVPCTAEKSWVYEDGNGCVCVNFPTGTDGGGVYITDYYTDDFLSYVWKHEISVSKFQHLLRDCGFTEQANNLKIN